MRLHLDPWQKNFLETQGDKILCTGRQVGKSFICGRDAGQWAINNRNKVIAMIAPTERQAYALFEKTLAYLMDYHKDKIFAKGLKRPTKTKIELKNGTRIYCLPVGTTGIGIRFLTIHRLYVDEASRVPEEVWAAITPALLTTGGDTILLSTPFGAQGEFWRCWINDNGAYDSFTRFSVTSEVVIRERKICTTWTKKQQEMGLLKLEQAKARMSNREYAQEYLGEFVEDLFRWFSDELIEKCCIGKREGINRGQRYYLGCDIARMGEDEGTFEILWRRKDGILVQVENMVTKKQLTTQTEKRIINLDKQYNFKRIYIDAGAGTLGVSIMDHLLDTKQVKRKVIAIDNAKRVLDRHSGATTKLLKEDLYDNLRALMEQGKIILLRDENLIESLRSIQYEYVQKSGQPTRLRIFGNYSHIAEGLIRAAWCVKDKSLNIWLACK